MITFETDLDGLDRQLAEFIRRMAGPMTRFAERIEDAVLREVRAGIRPRGFSSGKLTRAWTRGGAGSLLRRRITVGGFEIEFGIDERLVPYWRIRDTGGIIKARPGSALGVPLHEEARKAVAAVDGDWRRLNLIYVRRKSKPPLLLDPRRGKPMAVLLKQVRHPASHYIRNGIARAQARAIPQAQRELETDLVALWNSL